MREHFYVPDHYFLSHSVGCLPRQSPERLEHDYLAQWKVDGGEAWPNWLDSLDTFREKLGAVLGSPARNICPQSNVSSSLTKLLYSLPKNDTKSTILCSLEDFPTTGFVFKQAERMGFHIKFVQGNVADPEAWFSAWDDSVGIVFITHAFSNTSKLAPVEELCSIARSRGVISIVDIAQSTGAIPVDIDLWKPDFVVGTGVKFLCFGPGACFLYASDEMIHTCAPIDVGWFSHEQPFEMDICNFQYADSAMRFFGGTPSPAPFILANAALELWDRLGLKQAQTQMQIHLDRLCGTISDDVLVSPKARNERGGTFVINPLEREPLRTDLKSNQIRYDERNEGLRFSIHGYTTETEVDLLVQILSSHGM